MSKPTSFKNEPFVSFDKAADGFFSEDFVHDKLFTAKLAQTASKGTINIKGSVSGTPQKAKFSDELKLWFPAWNRGGTLYLKSKGNDLKVHYDDGTKVWSEKNGLRINPFVSIQHDRNLKNMVLKAGSNILAAEWNFGYRIRYAFNDDKGDVSIAKKFHWAKGDWSFAAFQAVNVMNWNILTNAIRIGYKKRGNQFFLKAENNNHRNIKSLEFGNPDSYFSDFTADWMRSFNEKTKAGMEATFTRKSFGNLSAVVRQNLPEKNASYKLRFSSNKSVAVSYQTKVQNYGKWTFGAELSDLGGKNNYRYGVQVDMNL